MNESYVMDGYMTFGTSYSLTVITMKRGKELLLKESSTSRIFGTVALKSGRMCTIGNMAGLTSKKHVG